jgi:hypothetical protein
LPEDRDLTSSEKVGKLFQKQTHKLKAGKIQTLCRWKKEEWDISSKEGIHRLSQKVCSVQELVS